MARFTDVLHPEAYANERPCVPYFGEFIVMVRYGRLRQNIVKTRIFTILVPGTVGVYIPYRLRGPGPHTIAALGLAGIAPVAAGVAVYLWCAWDFATFGRGTPLPLDAPKQLVAHGLYRLDRIGRNRARSRGCCRVPLVCVGLCHLRSRYTASPGRAQAVGGPRSLPVRPQSDVRGRAARDLRSGALVRIGRDPMVRARDRAYVSLDGGFLRGADAARQIWRILRGVLQDCSALDT